MSTVVKNDKREFLKYIGLAGVASAIALAGAKDSLAQTVISGASLKSDKIEAPTGRTATVVVAANNSSTKAKEQADLICDGVDDQVQLQAASELIKTSGGKIFLSAGTYNVSVAAQGFALTLYSNAVLEGEGYATKILLNNSQPSTHYGIISLVNCNNVTIRGIYVDGNYTNQVDGGDDVYQGGIVYGNSFDCLIERCYVNNVLRVAYSEVFDGTYGDSERVHMFHNVAVYGRFTCSKEAIVAHNYCINSNSAAGIEAFAAAPAGNSETGVQILNNVIYNPLVNGIDCYSVQGAASDCDNILIQGNYIINPGVKGILIQYAAENVRCLNNHVDGGDIYIGGSKGVLVSGNQVFNAAIAIQSDSTSCTIVNNHIENAGSSGILLYGARYCSVNGNYIKNVGQDTDATYYAISAQNHASFADGYNDIVNNIIYNDATNRPLYGVCVDTACVSTRVRGNSIGGCVEGVYIAADNCEVTGNRIDGAITVAGANCMLANNYITDNDLKNSGNYCIISGTSPIIDGNVCTGTANGDPKSFFDIISSGVVTFTNNTIRDTGRSGLKIYNATANISGNTIRNFGAYGIGFYVNNAGTITGSIICNNHLSTGGTGFRLHQISGTIDYCIVKNNMLYGIGTPLSSTITGVNNIISDNVV